MTTVIHPSVGIYLRNVHNGELALERELQQVAHRHHDEHEIRHVAVDLARWSLENRQSLRTLAARYGGNLDDDQTPEAPSAPMAVVREKAAELLGRHPEPGLLLLSDLQHVYLMASDNSVSWTILGQAAQAAHDQELLGIVTECHSKTMRQAVWCNATIKALSPQILLAL